MRTPLIAGNWKMNNDVAATTALLEGLLTAKLPATVEVVVCPSFLSIPSATMMLASSGISVGAQNVHWEASGAFTGEVSPAMLRGAGVEWAIVAHSERRSLFGETDASAIRRAAAAQEHRLQVMFCIGETLEEREAGSTFEVLERQIDEVVELDPDMLAVAYEPVWAIGTGLTATPEQAQKAHAFIRGRLAGAFGSSEADSVRILYGGSMKPDNALELISQRDVDGGLIGGASLDVDSFSAIIRAAADCASGDIK